MSTTPREHILSILNRQNSGKPGYWTGNPHGDTLPIYYSKLGVTSTEALYRHFGDDVRWIPADSGYKHPEGKPALDALGGKPRVNLNDPGVFAETETVAEVDAYDWPNPDYLDFSGVLARVVASSHYGVWTGLWSPFFHDVADHFGMDNYFIAMYERPEIVEAVTDHIVSYYVEANRRYFDALGDSADAFFFGNDFGTQRGLFLSQDMFARFVLPSMRRLIGVAKAHGKKVVLHSCGSIATAIPSLIEAGVDALHPLQARATGMEATVLAREFAKDLAFVGGVDTQDLLVTGSPQQIYDEVMRLREVFGPNFVVSPSHEALLPNVPVANVEAMSRAARA